MKIHPVSIQETLYYMMLDGSISDIGALNFNLICSNFGDLNNDNDINVLDIINLVNCILFNNVIFAQI